LYVYFVKDLFVHKPNINLTVLDEQGHNSGCKKIKVAKISSSNMDQQDFRKNLYENVFFVHSDAFLSEVQ